MNSCAALLVEGALRPRLAALHLHRAVEALAVERQPALARKVLDEVERQPERVVQLERLVAGHRRRAVGGALEHLLEPRQARRQHRVEALLLAR